MTKYLTLVLALFLLCFYGSACYDGFYMLIRDEASTKKKYSSKYKVLTVLKVLE